MRPAANGLHGKRVERENQRQETLREIFTLVFPQVPEMAGRRESCALSMRGYVVGNQNA